MTLTSNYLYEPASILVYPGGGAAPDAKAPTSSSQVLTSSLVDGVFVADWAALPGSISSGAAATKGSFTFTAGTHAKILTTAAIDGCVISYTIVSLGTVTAAQAILTTIDDGVGFTPVSADNTDTSTVNWAILA